jgi:hypothetical protein
MKRFHRPGEEKRMVVILDEAEFSAWLEAPQDRMRSFMRCFPADLLEAEPDPLRGSEAGSAADSHVVAVIVVDGREGLEEFDRQRAQRGVVRLVGTCETLVGVDAVVAQARRLYRHAMQAHRAHEGAQRGRLDAAAHGQGHGLCLLAQEFGRRVKQVGRLGGAVHGRHDRSAQPPCSAQ